MSSITDSGKGVASQIDRDLWVIDTLFQGEPGVIASYLLTGQNGLGLVDVGSGASVDQVLAGVRAAGYDPQHIQHLILTHVHLDHAGAAGTLTRLLPQAHVYVHRIGAPHLIDPSKLISSAARIYGDRMQTLWGTMEPVPENRLTILDDGDSVSVGERRLKAIYTPGHAIHHLAYYDETHAALFAGDIAGVRLQGLSYVRPPTPPPDLNLEQWSASLDRLAALGLQTLYLPHFGPAASVEAHFKELRKRLDEWGRLLLPGIRAHKSDQELAADLAAHANPEIAAVLGSSASDGLVHRYELATNYLMSAQGYVRYFTKVHPEQLG